MKRMLPLLIGLLFVAAAAYYFLKKKDVAESSAESLSSDLEPVPNRTNLVSQMNKYIDELYTGNYSQYKETAKKWANQMYTWCLNQQNGWTFESQQEKAKQNGYSLALQMVQSIAWQLHGTLNLYPSSVWKDLESKIFDLASK